MPLYLVRWPGTRASIVKASGEEELIALIDEIDAPGQFTWSVYRGPVWVDFSLPVKVKMEQRHPGPLRRDEFEVTDVDAFVGGRLRVSAPEAEIGLEMEDAVLSGAFPKTAAVYNAQGKRGDAPPNTSRLREAIVSDVIDHDEATALDGSRIGPDLALRRTTTWLFRRLDGGTFKELPAKKLFEFLCGEAKLEPEPDGAVRVCFVEVVLKEKKPVEARLGAWSRFPTEKDGRIRAAYSAREFMVGLEPKPIAPEGMLDAAARFLEQRKKALEWTPNVQDVVAAAEAVNEKAGEPIVVLDE